jgi:hypothetical protein
MFLPPFDGGRSGRGRLHSKAQPPLSLSPETGASIKPVGRLGLRYQQVSKYMSNNEAIRHLYSLPEVSGATDSTVRAVAIAEKK